MEYQVSTDDIEVVSLEIRSVFLSLLVLEMESTVKNV